VEIVNCVDGLASPAMQAVLAAGRGDVIVMHALAVPADPALLLAPDCDPVEVVLAWKDGVLATAREAGIDAARLVFDPGIGFGKRARQSLALVLGADRLVASGGRWLFGHSRKSFLALFTGAPAAGRDDLTLALSAGLAHAGVHMLRVHDVARHAAYFDA
jgi:dihydropteroate synthase